LRVYEGWPDWIDFARLKVMLLSTIVAISSIKLLEVFLDVPEVNDRDLYSYIAVPTLPSSFRRSPLL
jgi:uncharacterized membrane protein YqhA